MTLSKDTVIALELKFIELCEGQGVQPKYDKHFLTYQRIFVYSTLEALAYSFGEKVEVEHWLWAVENKRFLIPKKDFYQLTLEIVNNRANAAMLLQNIRRKERKQRGNVKIKKDLDLWL